MTARIRFGLESCQVCKRGFGFCSVLSEMRVLVRFVLFLFSSIPISTVEFHGLLVDFLKWR